MALRRSRLEILVDVLRVVNDGVEKPTHIMFASKMSWELSQKTLTYLVRHELIRETRIPGKKRSRRIYEITRKGNNTLRYFNGIEKLIQVSVDAA